MTGLPFVQTHSSLDTFATCPKKYQAQYVTKELKYTPSEHTALGNTVHKLAEWYVKYLLGKPVPVSPEDWATIVLTADAYAAAVAATDSAPLCPPLNDVRIHWANVKQFIDKIPKGSNVHMWTELSLAFNGDFVPCDYMDKGGLFRAKIDLLVVTGNLALLGDYKTSKELKDSKQLARSACCVFVNFSEVDTVHTLLISTRGQPPIKKVFKRAEFLDLYNNNIKFPLLELKQAYASGHWEPIPSGLCNGWCEVMSCQHRKEKRK